MCTVLVLYRAHSAAPLVIAANRDEFYGRPTTGPARLFEEPVVAIGGRDLRHGGSWMGLNAAGLFVGLTNMRSFDGGRRSRGEIVLEALACRDAQAVIALLRRDAGGGEYRPFNLLFGGPEALYVAYHRSDSLRIDAVAPGPHVLPSGGVLDDPELPKSTRGLELLAAAAGAADLEALLPRLYEALGDDWVPSPSQLPRALRQSELGAQIEAQVQAINVKTKVYGTRSSTLVVLGAGPPRYYYADGPPPVELARVDDLLVAGEATPEER